MSILTKKLTVESIFRFHFYGGMAMLCLFSSCNQNSAVQEEDQFSLHIRTSESRSPEEERLGFDLPPGFEIQLYASEPDISKPLNMTFDAKGRMWLTHTYEYPFADTTGVGKDRITILEDSDKDGRADKFTVFADSLNIPIGIVTVPDGAIAYSIPHIYHFIDKDGDDQVDHRKVLLSGFEYKDTHGMINNMVRSWDGWIHADHGFSNTSKVTGVSGDTLVMFSGNTFRFRPDGSQIEFTTTGRVNPYGYTYDELGYTYSVDCHTSPIYQLIRGADYPHFGKQPTGIGFGPALMQHNYGSTALAGLEYYIADQFPKEYQNSFYMGDVVKSRVYRSTITMEGTTPKVEWQPDFIVSEDPWFRPVDVKLGPDGALYIADFYNRIIGHYEVALDHPGRDRNSGRIWRVTYNEKKHENGEELKNVEDLSTANLTELVSDLNNPNLSLRMATADQIVDRFGAEAVDELVALLESPTTDALSYVQSMWILFRLSALPETVLLNSADHEDIRVKVHTLRILFEYETLHETLQKKAYEALYDTSPHVQRQAIMVISKHAKVEYISVLLDLYRSVQKGKDTHMSYVLRQALRDHLRNKHILQWVQIETWPEANSRVLADALLGVFNVDAADFLITHIQNFNEEQDQLVRLVTHTSRFIAPGELDRLIAQTRSISSGDLGLEYKLYKAIQKGLTQSGHSMNEKGKTWGISLASTLLDNGIDNKHYWQVIPNQHMPFSSNPWRLVEIDEPTSQQQITLLSSGPIDKSGGDISTITSPVFTLSSSFEFYLSGRKRPPSTNQIPLKPINRVELRLVGSDSLIAANYLKEDVVNEKITWTLDGFSGKQAYLTVVDGTPAWEEYIAVGQFGPGTISIPKVGPLKTAERQIFASQIAKSYRSKNLEKPLEILFISGRADIYARIAACDALLSIDNEKHLTKIASVLRQEESNLLKEQISLLISQQPTPKKYMALDSAIHQLSYNTQKSIALNVVASEEGIDFLLRTVNTLNIPPRILLEPQIKQMLMNKMSDIQKLEYDKLVSKVKPLNKTIETVIDDRLKGFRNSTPSAEEGRQLFSVYCSNCHQINNMGGDIGPQLDGIGNWGHRALTEKILDPNRNVSRVFVNYDISLANGNIASGMLRREEGETIVFANVAGQEFSLTKKEILEMNVSPYTLMPDNFGEMISDEEYYALLSYLLSEN